MRAVRLLASPFGVCVLACLVLAGWALWSGGLLDGPVARQVRTSSVYAAPGIDLDQAAAERVIGNRRLVVVLLEPGADRAAGCDRVRRAAAGTLVLLLSPGDGGYDTYGCSLLTGGDDDFGRALVAETTVGRGIDDFPDRPLEALKVIAVNYDLLVKVGLVPDGGRTVSPSLPRYLAAAAAVLAVLIGATVAYAAARRAGRLAAGHLVRREAAADNRRTLSAATAALAQQIIDLDRRHPESAPLAVEYADLLQAVAGVAGQDEPDLTPLIRRVESLGDRCRALAESPG